MRPNIIVEGRMPTSSEAKPLAQIQVLRVTPVANAGNLKALVDIACGAFEFHGLRIVGQPGQRAYVQWPQAAGKDRASWFPVIRCNSQQLDQAVKAAVLRAWQAQQGQGVLP